MVSPETLEAASSMEGISPPYQRLAYLIAKCCDLTKLLPSKPVDFHISVQLNPVINVGEDEALNEEEKKALEEDRALNEEEEKALEDATTYRNVLETYCAQPFSERRPDELPPFLKMQIAQYCGEDKYPTDTIMKSFGNWHDLGKYIKKFEELREECHPSRVAAFIQLADQVCVSLGFREEKRKVGLRAARRQVDVALNNIPHIQPNDVNGQAVPIFIGAEDIMMQLISFHCRTLPGMGRNYRKRISILLKHSGIPNSSTYRNYLNGKMQLGNKVDTLFRVSQYIREDIDLLRQFQNRFGTSCEVIIDQQRWEPYLRRLAIIRGAIAHPDVVVTDDDLQEIRGILTDSERVHFTDDKLDFELTDQQQKKVRFDPRQLRPLLKNAYQSLRIFYEELGNSIFPEVQFHERLEIGRDGKAYLTYTDEDDCARTLDLGLKRNFKRIYYPGRHVFFKQLQNGRPVWISVQE